MNLSELNTRIQRTAHRTFAVADLANFVLDSTERINRRLNLQLVNPVVGTDTNEVLTDYPLLYIYAALCSAYQHLNNGDNAIYYDGLWETECDRQNVTQAASTDVYATEPPVMTGA